MNIEPLVNETAVAQHLGVSLSWLRKDRAQPNTLIPYIKIRNSVRYKMSVVVEAVDKLARNSPSPAPTPAPVPQPPVPDAPPRRGRGRPRNSDVRHA